MKRSVFERTLSIMLAVLCLILPLAVVQADDGGADEPAEYEQIPRSGFMSSYSYELKNGTSHHLKVEIEIETYFPMDRLGFDSIKLQRYVNGEWVDVDSFSAEYVYNTTTFSVTKTFSNTVTGGTYRAVCKLSAKLSALIDRKTVTTNTKIST